MTEPGHDTELHEAAERARDGLGALRAEIHKVIVGQDDLIDRILTGLLCNAHLLLEGVPGLAKTLCVTTLAEALDAQYSRIQFTPDLLPGDVLGSEIYSPQTGEFSTRRGPIFANLVLADEINRAPAKVQSALLEAMQEHQVTIGGTSFQEGTYPLPEAQVDRFMLKLRVPYPQKDEELAIIDRMAVSDPSFQVCKVLSPQDIVRFRAVADRVYVDGRAKSYAVDIVRLSRQAPMEMDLNALIEWGASPRASMYLVMAARARALLEGRMFVAPDDVRAIAPDILRHRLILTFEAEAEGIDVDDVIRQILEHVPVP